MAFAINLGVTPSLCGLYRLLWALKAQNPMSAGSIGTVNASPFPAWDRSGDSTTPSAVAGETRRNTPQLVTSEGFEIHQPSAWPPGETSSHRLTPAALTPLSHPRPARWLGGTMAQCNERPTACLDSSQSIASSAVAGKPTVTSRFGGAGVLL